MSSPAITTVVKMMESLPQDLQDTIAEHLKEYLADLQSKKQFIMIAGIPENSKSNFFEEFVTPVNKKPTLSESIAQFRQELIDEEIEINPDEVWENIRNYVPGREVIW